MVFPFTFTSILPYPFSPPEEPPTRPEPEQRQSHWLRIAADNASNTTPSRARLSRPPLRVIPEETESPALLLRKRGWEPAVSPTAVVATTSNRLANGHFADDFDRRTEYEDGGKRGGGSLILSSDRFFDNTTAPPAPKRRRLGETILETALNAALVGTAVGLAALRLWRDRGKDAEDTPPVLAKNDPPPPPYEPRPAYTQAPEPPQQSTSTPSTSAARPGVYRKPTRPIRASPRKTPSVRKLPTARASTMTLRSSALDHELSHKRSNMTMAAPESYDNEEGSVDGQMDWMSERLRGLIEQGQEALRKEVVVTDESVLDEHQGVEDDGSLDWEDDEQITHLKRSRSNASLPALSRSVSQRDLHAPVQSPYKLPPLPASRIKGAQAPPPSAWSAGRTRTAPVAIPSSPPREPVSHAASRSRSFTTPSPSRRPSTHDLSRHYPTTYTPCASNDDDLISASPEMRNFMEQARHARIDR